MLKEEHSGEIAGSIDRHAGLLRMPSVFGKLPMHLERELPSELRNTGTPQLACQHGVREMDKTQIRDEIVRQFGDGEVRVYMSDVEVVLVKWKRLSATISWRSGPVCVTIADKDEQPTDILENRIVDEVMPSNLTESQIVETMVKTMKQYDHLKVGRAGSESTRSFTEG